MTPAPGNAVSVPLLFNKILLSEISKLIAPNVAVPVTSKSPITFTVSATYPVSIRPLPLPITRFVFVPPIIILLASANSVTSLLKSVVFILSAPIVILPPTATDWPNDASNSVSNLPGM